MTPSEIDATPDHAIDSSDTPDPDETVWQNARLIDPDRTRAVTLLIKKSVLDTYNAQGEGYQTRMNALPESYVTTRLRRRRG